MPLTKDDLKAICALMEEKISPLQEEIQSVRSDMNAGFDHLYKQDEKREQEYLSMREQLGRVETDVKVIRDAVERHDDELDALKIDRSANVDRD